MKKNYDILKQIIELYGDYEYEGRPLNLFDFAQWLVSRVNEDREYSEESKESTF